MPAHFSQTGSLRLMARGTISGLFDLDAGGFGRGPNSWHVGRATPTSNPVYKLCLPTLLHWGSALIRLLGKCFCHPWSQPETCPPPQLPLAGRGGGGECCFPPRSELHTPALGSHPITLTGQFTGQLCSRTEIITVYESCCREGEQAEEGRKGRISAFQQGRPGEAQSPLPPFLVNAHTAYART